MDIYLSVDIETLGTNLDDAPVTEVSYIQFGIDDVFLTLLDHDKNKIDLLTIPDSVVVDYKTLEWRLRNAPAIQGNVDHKACMLRTHEVIKQSNYVISRGHFDIPILYSNLNGYFHNFAPVQYSKFIDARTLHRIPKVKAAVPANPKPHDSLYDALHNVIVFAEAYDLVINADACPHLQSLLTTFVQQQTQSPQG